MLATERLLEIEERFSEQVSRIIPIELDGVRGRGSRARVVPLPGGAEMEFVWLEPGTLRMGASAAEPGSDADGNPQHEVAIRRGFWMAAREVTQGQWTAAMADTGRMPEAGHRLLGAAGSVFYPIEYTGTTTLRLALRRPRIVSSMVFSTFAV